MNTSYTQRSYIILKHFETSKKIDFDTMLVSHHLFLPASSTTSLLSLAHSTENVWWRISPRSAPHHLPGKLVLAPTGVYSPKSAIQPAKPRSSTFCRIRVLYQSLGKLKWMLTLKIQISVSHSGLCHEVKCNRFILSSFRSRLSHL